MIALRLACNIQKVVFETLSRHQNSFFALVGRLGLNVCECECVCRALLNALPPSLLLLLLLQT